jgi:hypothetical protein
MSKPHVEHIHIAGAAGAPMRRLREATAIKGLGLAGDRYWARADGYLHWRLLRGRGAYTRRRTSRRPRVSSRHASDLK